MTWTEGGRANKRKRNTGKKNTEMTGDGRRKRENGLNHNVEEQAQTHDACQMSKWNNGPSHQEEAYSSPAGIGRTRYTMYIKDQWGKIVQVTSQRITQ